MRRSLPADLERTIAEVLEAYPNASATQVWLEVNRAYKVDVESRPAVVSLRTIERRLRETRDETGEWTIEDAKSPEDARLVLECLLLVPGGVSRRVADAIVTVRRILPDREPVEAATLARVISRVGAGTATTMLASVLRADAEAVSHENEQYRRSVETLKGDKK